MGTFDQWRFLTGSVLCLVPGLDLGLEPSLAPGMNGLYNFQVTVNFVNPSPQGTNYFLYIVSLTSGLVTIKDNGTVTQVGLITRSDVLAAQQAPSIGYTEAVKLVGGNLKLFQSPAFDEGIADIYGLASKWAPKLFGNPSAVAPGAGMGLMGAGLSGQGEQQGAPIQPSAYYQDNNYRPPELNAGYDYNYGQGGRGGGGGDYYDDDGDSPRTPEERERGRSGPRPYRDAPGPPPVNLSRQRVHGPERADPRGDGPRFR
jgi:hypothetical protein